LPGIQYSYSEGYGTIKDAPGIRNLEPYVRRAYIGSFFHII